MRPLPDWLRRQRAQWLVNLGKVSVVGAASCARETLRPAPAPEFPIYVVEGAFVAGGQAFMSRSLDPPFEVLEESVGYHGRHGMVKRFLRGDLNPSRAHDLGDAMCLAIYLSWNYYHWVLEILPKAALAEAAGFRGRYLVPDHPYVKESLALLGIASERLVVHQPSQIWRVARLYITGPIDTQINVSCPGALVYLRKRLLDALPKAPSPLRRLYVSRNRPGRTRQVVNEFELKQLLDYYGFSEFFAEDYALADQFSAFSAAEAVVGVEGAGLANALMMPERGLLLALFSPLRYAPENPLVVARLNRLRYFTVFAKTSNREPYPHGDNIVADIDLIAATLDREMSGPKLAQ